MAQIWFLPLKDGVAWIRVLKKRCGSVAEIGNADASASIEKYHVDRHSNLNLLDVIFSGLIYHTVLCYEGNLSER